jgi:pimeloyl-ACP methyl ester carboxylesterase
MLKNRRLLIVLAAIMLVFVVFPLAGGLIYLKVNAARLLFQSDRSLRWTGLPVPAPPGMQVVQVAAPGGAPLHGYTVMPAPGLDLGFWVLHLHGNADSVFSDTQLRNMQALRAQGLAVLAIDYRGFGPSPGRPSEQGLYEGAEAAWQWLTGHGVAPERIIIWGHSMGAGPAVQLATLHRAAALVTFGGFTSMADMVARQRPWLPVRWLIGVQLDSLARMPQVQSPVVVAHCVTDRAVPFINAQRLFDAAPQPKRLLRLEMRSDDGGGGHVTALYEQLDLLMPLLREVAGVGQGTAAAPQPLATPRAAAAPG